MLREAAIAVLASLLVAGADTIAATARPAQPPPRSAPKTCNPGRFRVLVDVGHTADAPGAKSARNRTEYEYNLQLATRLHGRLAEEGFSVARLMVAAGEAKASLFRRVREANGNGDLLLSIHHDSVPEIFLEDWEVDGQKARFSDRFAGHSLFVSRKSPHFKPSYNVARRIGRELKDRGLHYAAHYTLPAMGRYRRQLLDKATGVYRYDDLVVLRTARMPAVLIEAGSIINRDEELKMQSLERQDLIIGAVIEAVKETCRLR